MALAMEFKSGNTTIKIMDDFCSYPDQAERDARIRKRVYANALAAIRANPEKYYAMELRRSGSQSQSARQTSERERKEKEKCKERQAQTN